MAVRDLPGASCAAVEVRGVLDAQGSAAFLSSLLASMPKPRRFVILDLAQATFLDSRGVGALMTLHVHLKRADSTLVLAAATGQPAEVLGAVGLASIIPMYASVEEAVAAVQ